MISELNYLAHECYQGVILLIQTIASFWSVVNRVVNMSWSNLSWLIHKDFKI